MSPPRAESNVITFPGQRPPSNAREIHNPSFNCGYRSGYTPSGRPSMHTFVFRSYELIIASSEAELIRDVRYDTAKARTKLKAIQEQMERDREHAAARANLLEAAERKLSAAIAAVRPGRLVEG